MGNIAATRRQAQTIAAAVNGVNRAILGSEHQDPSSEFLADLLGSPVVIIAPAHYTGIETTLQAGQAVKSFEFDVHLLFAYAAHNDFDNTAIEDLYELLTRAFWTPGNWTGASVSACIDVSPFAFSAELKASPIVSKWTATLRFKGAV